MRYLHVIGLSVTLLLAACATPYQRIGTSVAGGFSATQISESVFEIRFSANGFTTPKRAYDFALLRASEVALEHDYPYFVLIGERDHTSKEIIHGGSTSYTNGTVNTYGNYGTYNGTTTTYDNDIPVTKPALSLRIMCLESMDSAGKHIGKIYVARDTRDQLRKEYDLDKP